MARRWPLLSGIAILVVAALAWGVDAWRTPSATPRRVAGTGAPRDWPAALTRADRAVAAARERAATRGGEWLVQETLANALLARGRLTGSFDDYAAAQASVDAAFATAPPGAGPHLTAAVTAFMLHRPAVAAAMLDAIDRYAVPVEADDRRAVTGLRGDIAFYRGHYADALTAYRAAGDMFRLAVFAWRMGRADAALALFDKVERDARWPTAQLLSGLDLQRGAIALQRGDRDAAAAAFARADAMFPGSWLITAHRAQMTALAGQVDAAIAADEAILRTVSAPEVMDALASLYRAKGDAARSRMWAARAGREWDRRVALLPEAAWGHAVEHELAFGDPGKALRMARADHAARPHGGTAVALGWAWLANGRPDRAWAVIAPVLASSWRSADRHLVAAQALLLLGRGEEAEAERDRALAINPHAADADAALIWFGH